MVMWSNIIRYLPHLKFPHCLFRVVQQNNQNARNIHNTSKMYLKMFQENENQHAYNVMQNYGYAAGLNIVENVFQPLAKEKFDNLQKVNWQKETPQEVFKMLSILGTYCSEHNICISNKQFDDFIDRLTDCIKFASDEELKLLFHSLYKWPPTESIRTRNYIEIWAALDDECLNRIVKWSFNEMLSFIALFYMLNVARPSDFSYKCLNKLASKAKKLNKAQVVQTMFFIGIVRRPPHDMHNLELYIEDNFSKFTIDELAIVAMGSFKSKTPIRSSVLITKIINKIMENAKQIHEVSLAALLKVIRYSMKITVDNKIYDMLDCLQHEIPRLSIMCNVHLALVGTATLTLHESCITKIADHVSQSMPNTRLKDLERLVLTYGTFNFIPKTKNCFITQVINELKKPEREEEISKHGKSFSCCIGYLGLLGIYPEELMSKVLSPAFLEHSYGKHCYLYGREVLTINNLVSIFFKEKSNHLLSHKQMIIMAKKFTDYIPDENYKKQYNFSERMFIDVKNALRDSRGGDQYVTGYHIITHHQRGDLIICNNNEGRPVPVDKAFKNKEFGLLYEPPDDNVWVALIIAGRNSMIYNKDNMFTGHFTSKVRELNKLGYYAAIVSWNIYSKLKTIEEKQKYLNKLIEEAVKHKKDK